MSEKKSVLITGASAGIGEAMALHFNSVGYRVVLLARRMDKLQALAAKLTEDTVCISYDLQNLSSIETVFLDIHKRGIKLYGLIHCAGINRDQPVKTNDIEDMNQVMHLNLMSFIELSKYFCRKKYSEDGGAIIAMSSTAVYGCDKSMCTYAASKAGVDAAVKVMAKEFAKRRIRVNSIQPTYVDTEMARNTPDYEAKFAAQPLGVIPPIEVAYLAEFLFSEKAGHISGSNLKISSAAI